MSSNQKENPAPKNNDAQDFDARRKVLEKAFPYLVVAAWQAHSALSPGTLLSNVVSQYEKVNQNAGASRDELRSLIKETGLLDLKVEGLGRLSLSLSNEQLLALIGNYLTSKFAREGATAKSFKLEAKENNECDARLYLPSRAVFAKLCKNSLDEPGIVSELERARARNPSDTWIFSYLGSQNREFLFEPVFLSENVTLQGRLRLMTVSHLLFELTRSRFVATVETFEQEENNGGTKARFLLSRLG